MEPSAAPRRLVYLIVALVVAATAGVIVSRRLMETPLSAMVRADLPMLDLVVKLRDLKGQDVNAGDTKIGDDRDVPAGDERCPALVGGDHSEATTAATGEPRPADCPQRASWYVKRHPIALSLYVEDGDALLDWYDHRPRVKEWVANRFVQGLLHGFLHSLKVKAEDLNLQGLQGEFMARLLREAVVARGQLHYDMVHGHHGWVLSFVRRDSAFAGKALPIMVAALARSGYKAARLPQPVLEMHVGLQRFFVTQHADRIYLAQGLEALLNVIESLTEPTGGVADAPVSLTVRLEAFVDKLLPVIAGAPRLDVTTAFSLKDGEPGTLSLPAGPWDKQLHERIFEGVIASIPQDTFAAVATSFRLPPTWTQQDWRRLATEGPGAQQPGAPEESGFALLWDFDGKNSPAGAIGIVVANQTEPMATSAYTQYLRDGDLSAECAGGALFLAATSEHLLTRMKESCARQSLSPLDWERGSGKQRYTSAQLVGFVNPGAGLKELFLAGGAGGTGDEDGDFAPRWKQDYEKAKAAMRTDGDRLFGQLPIFAYSGRAGGGKTVTLEGHAVSQGVSP